MPWPMLRRGVSTGIIKIDEKEFNDDVGRIPFHAAYAFNVSMISMASTGPMYGF